MTDCEFRTLFQPFFERGVFKQLGIKSFKELVEMRNKVINKALAVEECNRIVEAATREFPEEAADMIRSDLSRSLSDIDISYFDITIKLFNSHVKESHKITVTNTMVTGNPSSSVTVRKRSE